MKVLGLFIVLGVSIAAGLFYWNSRTFDAQALPLSYKVLDTLESEGLSAISQGLDFKTLDGNQLSLNSLQGKVVILSFWATWCEPCVEEFPSFLKLLDAFPEKVVLVAVSHDESESDVRQFVEAFKGYRPNLILTMDESKKLSRAFGVDRLPEGFVFDGKGLLKKKIIGIQDWATPSALEFFKSL